VNATTQTTYDDLVNALLHSGWQHGEAPMGLLVAVGAYVGAPERPERGGFKPGSRVPWSGEAVSLRIDFERDVAMLHHKACVQVFGHPVRQGSVVGAINHMGTLIEKLDQDDVEAILKRFRAVQRRCLVLLGEEVPAWRIPFTCPDCHAQDREHAVMANTVTETIECTGCHALWTFSDLREPMGA